MKKNSQLNLSAIRDPEGIHIKHIQDALQLLETGLFTTGKKVIDVGTGGGFPLLPLAMSCPELSFIGIDSIRKKTIVVNEMIAELGLKNAKVERSRIEEYKEEKADLITARAVAYSDKLLNWAFPLLKTGGAFLLMKEEKEEERKLLLSLCKKYCLVLENELKYQLFDGDIQRVIYVLRK